MGADPASTSLEARLLDAVQQAVIATDVAGTVIFWNAHAERLFGWTRVEALGRSILELTPAETSREEAAAIFARLAQGRSWAGEFRVRRKDGTSFLAFVVNSPLLDPEGALVGVIGVSTDVSERRTVDTRVFEASKVEALGRLAGGVSHDFNNLLTVILGNLDVVETAVEAAASARERLAEIRESASRAATLTRQLLTFSRRGMIRPQTVDVGAGLRAMLPMLQRLIGEDIVITVEIDGPELYAVFDPGHLDQLVMNLVLNARDAMPGGGRLVLRLASVDLAAPGAPRVDGGALLRLSVIDSGTGIPAEHLSHIFEPFFTTKDGVGTGLGLATVHGIVQQAAGSIQVESDASGTSFHVFVPRAPAPAKVEPRAIPERVEVHPGREILLVDDEPLIRTLTTRMLSRAGYVVVSVESGDRALQLLEQRATPPALVITDIVMPGISGVTLAERLRARWPALPVLFMTGYSEEDLLRRGANMGLTTVLTKPFTAPDLLAAASAALAPSR